MGFPSDAAKTLVLTGQVPNQWITGTCPPSCTAGAGMVQHDSKIPYSEQANLEIDRQIGSGLTISAGYIWVAAHHLVRAENLNVCPPFGAAAGTTVPNVTSRHSGLSARRGASGRLARRKGLFLQRIESRGLARVFQLRTALLHGQHRQFRLQRAHTRK